MRPRIAALASALGGLATLSAAAAPIPEYRAAYRLDAGDEAAVGTEEVGLSYDAATGRYTLSVTDTEHKFPARARTVILTFDLVDDDVRPDTMRWEYGTCAVCTRIYLFDWARRGVEMRNRGYALRWSLSQKTNLVIYLAGVAALLPGRRELVGFEGAYFTESDGAVELATAVGRVHAERVALRGGKDATADADLWLARELGDLPVRMESRTPSKPAQTLELTELHGIGTVADRDVTERN
jgi:hypothetical protein